MKVASEGLKISGVLFGLSIVFFYLRYLVLGSVFLFFALAVLFFFRDPDREINGEGVVSPADGKVLDVKTVGGRPVVCIFLSLLDVHVNRVPLSGEVVDVEHHPGRYIPAFKKESENNERNEVFLSTDWGEFKVVQIAGFSARRIRCYINPGEVVDRGSRFGLIAFSSRVDLYFPEEFDLDCIGVDEGDRLVAGVTKVADLPED
ncbi:Phosphatidylserine decarboxylase Pcd [Methanonatronarchaeum thermophilum]|uniref:Putative archaetidylserine decarboxylase proenzyme n=1 Tax=Methanonatronarchaeum thermophilum TaxID=1927129 RepID=A0A1Y3GI88_9EURY|nr:phosphatidylserine decarboxylase [Methanonatronarchaeum thermophilum]OUJ19155.1 Phosphatidylserine decarboxylase Pcd [Methanonatronarchaeum thermophilum]